MKDTKQIKRNQNFTKKKQYGLDTQSHRMESDPTEKTDEINKLEHPTNAKTLKSFLGAIQYFAKFIPNLSEKTDKIRQLLKKRNKMELNRRTQHRLPQNKTRTNISTVPSPLKRK